MITLPSVIKKLVNSENAGTFSSHKTDLRKVSPKDILQENLVNSYKHQN